MTVKAVCDKLKCADEVVVMLNGQSYNVLEKSAPGYDQLLLKVLGSYAVDSIMAMSEGQFLLDVLMAPVEEVTA